MLYFLCLFYVYEFIVIFYYLLFNIICLKCTDIKMARPLYYVVNIK